MSDQSTSVPLLELGIDQAAYDRIAEAIAYFEENEPENPIGVGDVCAKSHENVIDVKKVLYYFLQTRRLLPSFKPYCKACGYLGDKAISVHHISDSCPCCYNKIMRIIDFWASGHRPKFDEKKSAVNA